jgi:hypothetical protein
MVQTVTEADDAGGSARHCSYERHVVTPGPFRRKGPTYVPLAEQDVVLHSN